MLLLVVIDISMKSAITSVSQNGMSSDRGNSTSDSGVVTLDVKMNATEGKDYSYQLERNAYSTTL